MKEHEKRSFSNFQQVDSTPGINPLISNILQMITYFLKYPLGCMKEGAECTDNTQKPNAYRIC